MNCRLCVDCAYWLATVGPLCEGCDRDLDRRLRHQLDAIEARRDDLMDREVSM